MAKKIIIAFAVIIFSLCCGICFAEENNSNIDLGNKMENALVDTKNGAEKIVNDVMDGKIVNDSTGNRSENVRKTTNSYNAYRTTDDTVITTDTVMNTTTWIWIILALAAIIIIAMIWYYAVQNTDNKD